MEPTRRELLLGASAGLLLPAMDVARFAGLEIEIGVCRGIDHAVSAAAAGASYLEVPTGQLAAGADPERQRAVEATFAATPLPIRAANSFLPGSLRCVGPDCDHGAVLAHAERVFERARALGLERIVFGSSAARRLPDGYPRDRAELELTALLARMGERAERHGIVVCLEPLQPSECNWLNRVSQGARVVRAVGHPNVGVTADLFHMLRSEEGADAIRDAGPWIRHVHVAENTDRAAPGTHGEDFTPYLRALAEIGYTERMSIECRWDDLDRQLPLAIATLRDQLARVG